MQVFGGAYRLLLHLQDCLIGIIETKEAAKTCMCTEVIKRTKENPCALVPHRDSQTQETGSLEHTQNL